MAQTTQTTTPATAKYTVLRAICMAGERVEVGETVDLTPVQYAEAFSAGKVGPLREKPAKPKKEEAAK